ncbi:piperideine-6-carboxylate dehydrogenase, partial [mine drainage metagenome]
EEWSSVPAPKRGEFIKKVSDALEMVKKELGLIVSMEVGKVISEGQGEIQEMIDIGHYATGLSRQLFGLTMASERPFHRMYEQWLPIGPIGVISAFNFPSAVWSWNSFIAAVCGDSTIWKPSSKAALTAIAVTKIVSSVMEKESTPPIFSTICGGGSEIGELMSRDTSIPVVSFTGSVATGKKISRNVAERLGKSILELGGNNGVIISGKADQNIAMKGLLFGALATAGQRCTTTRRAIVEESIYKRFVEDLKIAY